LQHLQAFRLLGRRRGIFEEEIDEADCTEQRVSDIVRDVSRKLAERGGASERDEQALDGGPAVIREGR
jgi:hypothetical protein